MLKAKLALPALLLAACGGSSKKAPVAPPPAPPPVEEAAEPPPPPPPQPVLTIKDAGLETPESVVYDATDDVYLVSKINGGPSAADGNGFISRISPDGQVEALKWIDGAKKSTKLNAPKGLAIAGEILYVADLDTLRMFDRKTGAAKGTVKLPGATFANDVAIGADGTVYVTDSGIKIDDQGVAPTGTDAVWAVVKKKAKKLAKGDELGKPNGIVVDASGAIWIASFGTGELYLLDAKGGRDKVQKLPTGALDGLRVDGETIWVSSWEGNSILKGTAGGEFEKVLGDVTSPADFGVDTKRNLILIPLFTQNTVLAFAL
jgi:sugar lactone lactonase YvrE